MPYPSFHHEPVSRPARHRIISTVVGVGVAALAVSAVGLAGAGAAWAASTRDILLTETDSNEPAGALGVGPIVIDYVTQRGYAIDSISSDLLVYDVVNGSMTPITDVTLGTGSADLAIDESTHQVVVSDSNDAYIRVVDGDPSSPTVNTVLFTYATGGTESGSIAVDSATHLSYVANVATNDVSAIDLTTGTRTLIPVGERPNDIAIDSSTATVYVASAEDRMITRIIGGVPTDTIFPTAPITLTYTSERLLVGTESATAPFEYTIQSFDSSLDRTAVSGLLSAIPVAVSVDPGIQLVYVTLGNGQLAGLRLDTLFSESGTSLVTGLIDSATVDPTTHHVFTVANTRARSILAAYDVQASPVLAARTDVNAQVGVPFSHFSDAVALPAVTQFAVSSGSLPPGLSLDSATGEIHGFANASGDYTFEITASNGFGTPGSGVVKIIVAPAAPVAPMITSGPPPAGQAGVAYSFTVTATGVPAPTFSVTGALPAGLSLDPVTGVISGTPTAQGSSAFTIIATNALDDWSEEYTIVIAAAAPVPTPTPTPTTAPAHPSGTGGTSSTPRALASTGADTGLPAGVALGVLALGAGLVLVRRVTVRHRRS